MRMTKAMLATGLALSAMFAAGPARAQDELLDLSTPEALQAAMLAAGYKAELKKNDDGSAFVLSAANGEPFTIDLTDCKALKCSGLSIQSFYKPEPIFTAEFANKWNAAKRFLKVSVNEKGELHEWLDITTHGKLTRANFADWIDWYSTMDVELAKFAREAREAAKAKK
ncbi:MAG: hypothetical protein A4S12_13975 [Proteobacteria bacterium SG_bin5]|nr:YbjN domain-containing protein [Sphingomonas sp.]OQW42704.1 MAG: hypothetical protein A4S12_13975 [Proteobacteria bacterium SG_bin5]